MRILILSDSDSPHTIRWAKAISQKDYIVGIFSIHKPDRILYSDTPSISLFSFNASRELQIKREAAFSKLYYIGATLLLKNVINKFKPNIVHAHYASSYGLLGALSGFHPLIVSVWGSDIYNFPDHSFIHRTLIRFNLSKADKILSTSNIMKKKTNKYTSKNVIVTPFGIDVDKFCPQKVKSLFEPNDLVIGTIKTLEKKYGIEFLIKAFLILKEKYREDSLKLLIVGSGSQEQYLKKMVNDFGIQNSTIFSGYISNDFVQNYHNMIDIYVAVSTEDSESFGVAILEASSCSKPVIVSNVGGLTEVVEDHKTGFIVEKENAESIVEAIEVLLNDENLRNELGRNGRNKVIKEYNWKDCVERMISIYNSTMSNINNK